MSNGLMVIPTASHPAGRLRVSYVTAVGRADAGRVQLTDDRLFLTPPFPLSQGRPQDFGSWVNAPLPPEAKKILKIGLRNGAFWSKCISE